MVNCLHDNQILILACAHEVHVIIISLQFDDQGWNKL